MSMRAACHIVVAPFFTVVPTQVGTHNLARIEETRSRGSRPSRGACHRAALRADPLALDRDDNYYIEKQNTGEGCSPVSNSRPVLHRRFMVWRRRRPLELRMPPARSRQRKRTRRTQRAHSVSRQGPRQVPPLLMWFEISRKRNCSEVVAWNYREICACRHARPEWRRQELDRAQKKSVCGATWRCTECGQRSRVAGFCRGTRMTNSRQAAHASPASPRRTPQKKVSICAVNDSLSLTNSRTLSIEASLKKLLAFSRV